MMLKIAISSIASDCAGVESVLTRFATSRETERLSVFYREFPNLQEPVPRSARG
jgi:hypothetical protein